jgi:DNA primase catalytic subunit
VEHLVGSNKFDKKKLVLNIVGSIFNLNLNETEVISNLIEFLHSNNLIKKIEKKADDFFLQKLNSIFPKKKAFGM